MFGNSEVKLTIKSQRSFFIGTLTKWHTLLVASSDQRYDALFTQKAAYVLYFVPLKLHSFLIQNIYLHGN